MPNRAVEPAYHEAMRVTGPYPQLLAAEYATEVLDQLVGEPIRAEVCRQQAVLLRAPGDAGRGEAAGSDGSPLRTAGPAASGGSRADSPAGFWRSPDDVAVPAELLAEPGDRLMVRQVRLVGRPMLDGRRGERVLAVATAWIINNRLPAGAVDDLLRTDLPIGRVLRRRAVHAPPEVLDFAIIPAGTYAEDLDVPVDYPVLRRFTCRRWDGRPIMVVHEVFSDAALRVADLADHDHDDGDGGGQDGDGQVGGGGEDDQAGDVGGDTGLAGSSEPADHSGGRAMTGPAPVGGGPSTSPGGARRSAVDVAVIGAGVAGLVAAILLARRGIDTVVLERCSRQEIESRPRAGLLGPGPVAVLERHGLADGLHAAGSPHHSCEFRYQRHAFVVDYAELAGGRHHTVYPQQHLVADLVATYLAAGGTIEFAVSDVRLTDLGDDRVKIGYTDAAGTRRRSAARFIAGCDGHHGVSRDSIPAGALLRTQQAAGAWAWLAILAAVPPSTERIIYAVGAGGFAGHMLRDDHTSRFYLQVPAGDDAGDWPEERIWAELRARLDVDAAWTLREGPLVEPPCVVTMEAAFFEPLRHGRLLLAGDAARRVPPAAAKGAGLAIADGESLADAIAANLHRGDTARLEAYSEVCQGRAWVSQEASTMLFGLVNVDHHNPFARRLQHVRLQALRTSRVAAAAFAEHYVAPI